MRENIKYVSGKGYVVHVYKELLKFSKTFLKIRKFKTYIKLDHRKCTVINNT